MKTYIYSLDCPETKMPKYIGKTINIKQRLAQHIRSNEKTKKYAWIKSLKNKGLKPILTLIDTIEHDWEFWEDWYIQYYKFLGFDLKNHKGGGVGGRLSPETRNKISLKLKGKKKSTEHKAKTIKNLNKGTPWNKGKKLTEEQKKIAIKALEDFRKNNTGYWKGKKRPQETIDKIKKSFAEKRKDKPKKERNKVVYKKISAYDLNNVFIFEIDMKDCKKLGYQKSNIINCIKGKRKIAHGYIWKYSQ